MNNDTIDILLIEDNSTDAELARMAIKKFDKPLRIEVIENGAIAVEFLTQCLQSDNGAAIPLPRLIFLDLKLPKLSGMEVLQMIKSNDILRIIPTIIFTSSRELCDIQFCYRHGANGYVVKPVEFREYTACVIETCRYWFSINCSPF